MKKQISVLIWILSGLGMSVMLYWKLRLAILRYIDIDEFAHLHWGYQYVSGLHPYRDFLYFFPPGFLWLLAPLFFVFSHASHIMIAARIVSFLWYIIFLFGIGYISYLIRGWRVSFLTMLFVLYIPIPSDKLLEVRPDTPAVALSLLAMVCLIHAWRRPSSFFSPSTWFFVSGCLYGLSLLILPKVICFVLVGCCMVIGDMLQGKGMLRTFWIGLGVSGVLVLSFFLWSGDISKAIYLTTVFASTSTRVLAEKFYMFPSHFFYPNDVYYAYGGVHSIMWINHVIFVLGIFGAFRSLVQFTPRYLHRRHDEDILVGLTCVMNIVAFVLLFPLKHAQYWILSIPFICFFSADIVVMISKRKKGTTEIATLFLTVVMLVQSYQMYQIKKHWTNDETMHDLSIIEEVIPSSARVWDLTGETINRKDAYYACCVPYGQYIEAFGFPLPDPQTWLDKTSDVYVYAGDEGRLSVLPPDQKEYIKEHFVSLSDSPLILHLK